MNTDIKAPKSSIPPPAYNIDSDQIKALVHATSRVTIIKRLEAAGVEIVDFGDEKVVLYEDIVKVLKANRKDEVAYIPKGSNRL